MSRGFLCNPYFTDRHGRACRPLWKRFKILFENPVLRSVLSWGRLEGCLVLLRVLQDSMFASAQTISTEHLKVT